MMDEESRALLDRVRAVVAERDALRALPVIATCGSCGWARDAGRITLTNAPAVLCGLVTHNSAGWRKPQPHDCKPPKWCPMRKGER